MKLSQYLKGEGLSYSRFGERAGLNAMAIWRAANGRGIGRYIAQQIEDATGGAVAHTDLKPSRVTDAKLAGELFGCARKCRVLLQVTLADVAVSIGLSESMLSRLERGERDWPLFEALAWRKFMLKRAARTRLMPEKDVPALEDLITTGPQVTPKKNRKAAK